MNIDQIRKETQGCNDKIFLNSAGSSLMPKSVLDKTINYLREEEQFGGYFVANKYAKLISEFYRETAKLINTKEQNIAFATNATDAYAKASSSIPFKSGDSIITTDDDYVSNQIALISLKKRLNIKIYRVRKLPNQEIDLDDLELLIKKHQPKLIAITHIPTNSGLVQNVEAVGEICQTQDILYLVDACQSVGQLVVDVQQIKCDFLTATGRKFLRGPRGTGFLFVSDKALGLKLAPLLLDMKDASWTSFDDFELGKTAKRFEFWEQSCASIIGLTEAVRYANEIGLSNIQSYNQVLSGNLRTLLSENSDLRVLDEGTKLSSIVTFHHQKMNLTELQQLLSNNNIYYSVSHKSSALIDFTRKNVDWALRFSPHYFNTKDEIEKVAAILA
ncbi:MAG: aminotransferase class V-fold PLP-dependent enzyme [Pedobacter sp.]|uniref:aminotransferase class V-fold PLP-dependent enzyme n=1 Tax=Pedobacter sp. TaxID=1411316 RepID=UPI0028083741|nr:aminotransferase class V-fold PLP-dependent enzyme [Pedobacter sp.]MDQ8005242.1 aminotransferase class V-fold PLP-dependent enzyme [Pedobacter sp.]